MASLKWSGVSSHNLYWYTICSYRKLKIEPAELSDEGDGEVEMLRPENWCLQSEVFPPLADIGERREWDVWGWICGKQSANVVELGWLASFRKKTTWFFFFGSQHSCALLDQIFFMFSIFFGWKFIKIIITII